MSDLMKEARRDQSDSEIERLTNELDCWIKRRKDKDKDENGVPRGQYDSQLNAVFKTVSVAAKIIRDDMGNQKLNLLSVGAAYAKCTQYDQLIIWLWRLFEYFREKFDQRDDPALQQPLRAADEVLWSCYKQFFQKPGMANRREPPPLPYIESEFSPMAVRQDQGPISLNKKPKYEPLQNHLNRMPIAVMRLSTITVSSPWSLVLIGHEVGHFIQPLIEPGFGYTALFAEALEKAAGEDEEQQQDWVSWAPEIFADWYSVLMMGPWALWVMAQFEMKERAAMRAERPDYPPPIVRLDLLAKLTEFYLPGEGNKVLKQLGLDEEIAAAQNEVKELKVTAKICKAIIGPLPYNLEEFDGLLNFRVSDFLESDDPKLDGDVSQWSKALQGKQAKKDDQNLRTARLIVAGAAKAWSEIMPTNNEAARKKAAAEVNQKTLERVLENGEKGTRAAQVKAPADAEAYGAELAKILLQADASQLVVE